MVSASQTQNEYDQKHFSLVNTILLLIAATAALGLGGQVYLKGTLGAAAFWGVASLLLNVGIIIGVYKLTVGRGAPTCLVGMTYFAWEIFTMFGIAGATLLLAFLSGVIH